MKRYALMGVIALGWATMSCGSVTQGATPAALESPVPAPTQSGDPAMRELLVPQPNPVPIEFNAASELHRVWIHNVEGGTIRGSRDGGKTWTDLGKITSPIRGGIWLPTVQNGVLAFNYSRGVSTVFATAVNAVHLRFSDPEGYSLPEDPYVPLIVPQGVSIIPKDDGENLSAEAKLRTAVTNIPGGTGFFGPEWSPRVGAKVLMGDGVRWAPIARDSGPDDRDPARAHILIVTPRGEKEVHYIEFENRVGGKVSILRTGDAKPTAIAQVVQPVLGIGRFAGSEYIAKPGVVRANHSGVICIGTTDARSNPRSLRADTLVEETRGGFQIVPSHHYADSSMISGGDHPEVYLVVGPLKTPAALPRYDFGVDGRYPLFENSLQAGTGKTFFKFRGGKKFVELNEAVAKGMIRRKDGTVVKHLRGKIFDAFHRVESIRFVPGTGAFPK